MVLSSAEPDTFILRWGEKIVFKVHTFSTYDGAQISWNAFHHTKHYPDSSIEQAGESTKMQILYRKPTQEAAQSLASGHSTPILHHLLIIWLRNQLKLSMKRILMLS